jgi:ubiquinone/menaquinone biosynthesis C-methylase UbiE
VTKTYLIGGIDWNIAGNIARVLQLHYLLQDSKVEQIIIAGQAILKGMIASEQAHIVAEGTDILIPRIAKLCSPIEEGLMLDVGCGFGTISGALQITLDMKPFGLDCNSELLKEANKKGIKTEQINLETDKFPFENETFNLALFIEVIEHMAKPEHCLSEIARVLKRNGELILTTPNLASFQGRIQILRGNDPLKVSVIDRAYDRHIRLYAKDSLIALLSEWFSITKVEYCTQYVSQSWKGLFRDFTCLFKKDLSDTIIVKCKKC